VGVFGRYGFQHASMELIAKAAGVSRPTLYQYFTGKDDIFRAMGAQLLNGVVLAARAAGEADEPLADRLYGALSVKLELVVGIVDSEFRRELLAEAGSVAADLMDEFKRQHGEVIEHVLTGAADQLDLLGTVLPAADCAALLLAALVGLSQEPEPPEIVFRRLRQLVELTLRSLTTGPAAALGIQPVTTAGERS
jgi:AcrR family transcriptional regulator